MENNSIDVIKTKNALRVVMHLAYTSVAMLIVFFLTSMGVSYADAFLLGTFESAKYSSPFSYVMDFWYIDLLFAVWWTAILVFAEAVCAILSSRPMFSGSLLICGIICAVTCAFNEVTYYLLFHFPESAYPASPYLSAGCLFMPVILLMLHYAVKLVWEGARRVPVPEEKGWPGQ